MNKALLRRLGNPCGTTQTDFPWENRDRNWEIYNMRVVEKRTLGHIANQYGVTRERVRQIVFKGERILALRKWLDLEAARNDKTILGSLTLSTRLRNALCNEIGDDWWLTDIRAFCSTTSKEDMRLLPNIGNKTLNDFHAILEEADKDAANLWASGHGKNNHPSQHG